MPTLALTYFDMHGGRGETARLALSIGGIEFEDRRIPIPEWAALKGGTPYGSIPVLEVDGRTVAQSNAINRYVGKLAGLYPTDDLQAALCDEVMDAVEDLTIPVVATFSISDPAELKARREALVDGLITFYLECLQKRLAAGGGEHFADGRLTVADLKTFVWIRHLQSGNLDHIPTDLVTRVAPLLAEHRARVGHHSGVKAYYEQRGVR